MILFHQRFYARWSFKKIHFHFLVVALGEVNQETSVMSSNYWVLSLFPTLKKIGKHNIQKSKYNFLKERHFVFRGFDKGELADYDDITLFYKSLTMKWYDTLIFLSSVPLDILFCQIAMFTKAGMAFVFGLQTLESIDFSKIYQLKGLQSKNNGHTKFYECCDLTKKVYLTCLVLDWFLSFSHVTIKIHYQRW